MFRTVLAPFTCLLLGLLPSQAGAGKSLGASYGPSEQVRFSLDWPRWGVYAQPILSWWDSDNSWTSRLEVGVRGGAQIAYTPFTYRAMECRLVGGAGSHFALRTVRNKQYDGEVQTRQQAVEAWMQPEFRFYERFSVLLQAQVLRYVIEGPLSSIAESRAEFVTPDLSLSGLRIGLKYYLPIGRR